MKWEILRPRRPLWHSLHSHLLRYHQLPAKYIILSVGRLNTTIFEYKVDGNEGGREVSHICNDGKRYDPLGINMHCYFIYGVSCRMLCRLPIHRMLSHCLCAYPTTICQEEEGGETSTECFTRFYFSHNLFLPPPRPTKSLKQKAIIEIIDSYDKARPYWHQSGNASSNFSSEANPIRIFPTVHDLRRTGVNLRGHLFTRSPQYPTAKPKNCEAGGPILSFKFIKKQKINKTKSKRNKS